MWLHQRTGKNTAVTVGAVGAFLGLVLAGIVLTSAPWYVWFVIAVIGGSILWSRQLDRAAHQRNHGDHPDLRCRHCQEEMAALRAREEQERAAADMYRLRGKYRH